MEKEIGNEDFKTEFSERGCCRGSAVGEDLEFPMFLSSNCCCKTTENCLFRTFYRNATECNFREQFV